MIAFIESRFYRLKDSIKSYRVDCHEIAYAISRNDGKSKIDSKKVIEIIKLYSKLEKI